MNRWKISTFILALVSVGLLALNVTGSNALQGRVGGGLAGTPDLTSDETDMILGAILDIQEELGDSTWTLESIGNYMRIIGENTEDEVTTFIEDEVDNSSWTLSSLATKIATECR